MHDVVAFPQPVVGWVGKEYGMCLALRAGGEELLFTSRGAIAARWIKVGEFIAEPESIMTRAEMRAGKGVADDE